MRAGLEGARHRDVDELARFGEARVVAARDEDRVEALLLGLADPLDHRVGAAMRVPDVGDVVERVDVRDVLEGDLRVGPGDGAAALQLLGDAGERVEDEDLHESLLQPSRLCGRQALVHGVAVGVVGPFVALGIGSASS